MDLQLGRIGWRHDDPTYRQVFASQFLPDGSRTLWDAFNDLQRATTSPPGRCSSPRSTGS